MRLLADSCVRGRTIRALREAGHDVEAVADWEGDPGDPAVLEYARRMARILLTVDSDFGTLIFRDGLLHGGVLFSRVRGTATEEVARLLAVLTAYAADLEMGALLAVDANRVRIVSVAERPPT